MARLVALVASDITHNTANGSTVLNPNGHCGERSRRERSRRECF
jgi:hypothetical protein